MTDKYFQFPSFVGSNLPDARQRLEEAMEARRTGRYEEALAAVIWLHEHALEYGPFISNVALREWVNLARAYPKANTALEET